MADLSKLREDPEIAAVLDDDAAEAAEARQLRKGEIDRCPRCGSDQMVVMRGPPWASVKRCDNCGEQVETPAPDYLPPATRQPAIEPGQDLRKDQGGEEYLNSRSQVGTDASETLADDALTAGLLFVIPQSFLPRTEPGPFEVLDPPPTNNRFLHPHHGTITFADLPIRIENAAGTVRRGADPSGRPWASRLPAHYGEFRATEGIDGDAVDVFVCPTANGDEPSAFVIHQVDDDGDPDEDKVMLGYPTAALALADYRACFDGCEPPDAEVREIHVADLRKWLADRRNRGQKITGGLMHDIERLREQAKALKT